MKRTILRETTFVVLLTISVFLLALATGCGYDASAPYSPPPPPPPSVIEGLWTSAGADPTVMRLAPSQLLASGDITPATAIFTSSAELFARNAIAFDTDGTMWVTSFDDSVLVAFDQALLTKSGGPDASVVISSREGSLSAPSAIAFDRQHRLWVANFGNGTIVRFDPGQLTTSGAPVPSVIISVPGKPSALAFDAAGSLWVANIANNKVFAYSLAQLETGGFLTPSVVIGTIGLSLQNPAGIAFDSDGNLWVGNVGGQNVVSYSAAQLAATGSPTPRVVLTSNAGSLGIPAGLAFDTEGSLWVMGGTGLLEKFPRTSLAASGAPAPAVTLRLTDYVLFWSVAFWPRPPGLPLY
jgi:sugar lactone lactonase YvrE